MFDCARHGSQISLVEAAQAADLWMKSRLGINRREGLEVRGLPTGAAL